MSDHSDNEQEAPREAVDNEEEEEDINEDPATHVVETLPDGSKYVKPLPPANYIKKQKLEICPVCQLPVGYCQFSSKHNPTKTAKSGHGGSAADPSKPDGDASGKGKNGKPLPKVVLTIKMRTKRKSTTTISGLEKRGVNVKEFAKGLAKKMSCSCATKEKAAEMCAVLQGDAAEQIVEYIIHTLQITEKEIQIIKKKQDAPKPMNK